MLDCWKDVAGWPSCIVSTYQDCGVRGQRVSGWHVCLHEGADLLRCGCAQVLYDDDQWARKHQPLNATSASVPG